MIPVRVASLAVPVLAITAIGTGCGAGGKQEVSATELVQKADAICRRERARFDEVQAHPPANAAIAADQTGELIGVTEAASGDLQDLEPPEQLRSGYERYLRARDDVLEQMRHGKQGADDQDSAAYAAAQTAVAKGAPERRRLAGAIGLRICGSNPGGA
jgi:hypothetical protein